MHANGPIPQKSRVARHPWATLEIIVSGKLIDGDYTLGHGCAIYRPANVGRLIRSERAESLLVAVSSGPRVTVADTTARSWSITLIQELETCEPGWQLIADGLI